MNKKSFFLGAVTGIILTLVIIFIIRLGKQDDSAKCDDSVKYLEHPVSYEHKKETSFKVFQVFDNAALASEISNEKYGFYHGNMVVILGENFYSDQVVTIKNPQRIGSYSYTNNGGMPMTVPIIDGKISE